MIHGRIEGATRDCLRVYACRTRSSSGEAPIHFPGTRERDTRPSCASAPARPRRASTSAYRRANCYTLSGHVVRATVTATSTRTRLPKARRCGRSRWTSTARSPCACPRAATRSAPPRKRAMSLRRSHDARSRSRTRRISPSPWRRQRPCGAVWSPPMAARGQMRSFQVVALLGRRRHRHRPASPRPCGRDVPKAPSSCAASSASAPFTSIGVPDGWERPAHPARQYPHRGIDARPPASRSTTFQSSSSGDDRPRCRTFRRNCLTGDSPLTIWTDLSAAFRGAAMMLGQ